MTSSSADLIQLTAQIVSAHCANSSMEADALPALIRTVHAALATVGAPASEATEAQAPAVPIKKSVFPEYIVCLEDGKQLKMLKRHLQSAYGMTPDAYRTKWGLPLSYPMVAPAYAEKRSALAHQTGLGRKVARPRAAEEATDALEVTRLPERKRGRRKA